MAGSDLAGMANLARQIADLPNQTLTRPGGQVLPFEIDSYRKPYLTSGTTDMARLGALSEVIGSFEQSQRNSTPWLWAEPA